METTLDEVSRGLERIGRWLANLGMHRAADELIEIGRALDDIAPLIQHRTALRRPAGLLPASGTPTRWKLEGVRLR